MEKTSNQGVTGLDVPTLALVTVTKPVALRIMKTSITLLTLALLGITATANAQERLTPSEAKHYAQLTRQNPNLLANAPLHVEADLEQAVALAKDDLGGLLIPIERLSEGTEADVGTEPVAIGELWLYNLTLEKNGWGISRSQLNVVPVNTDEGRIHAPRCILAVRKTEANKPVLMVYGKDLHPLLTLPLSKVEKNQSSPLDMSATGEGVINVCILGQYQASFTVAELFL